MHAWVQFAIAILTPCFACTAAGRYEGNQHIENPRGTPLANFFMTLAAKEGAHLDSFGDSTGTMEV